jgi:hypothetical protein
MVNTTRAMLGWDDMLQDDHDAENKLELRPGFGNKNWPGKASETAPG